MNEAEKLLEKFARKNMIQWNQEFFKRTHSRLHKSIIEALNEALHIHVECMVSFEARKCTIPSVSERFYSEKDLIAAAKYGYEYRDTTSFPQKSFEDNCENNVRQWIVGVLNAR